MGNDPVNMKDSTGMQQEVNAACANKFKFYCILIGNGEARITIHEEQGPIKSDGIYSDLLPDACEPDVVCADEDGGNVIKKEPAIEDPKDANAEANSEDSSAGSEDKDKDKKKTGVKTGDGQKSQNQTPSNNDQQANASKTHGGMYENGLIVCDGQFIVCK